MTTEGAAQDRGAAGAARTTALAARHDVLLLDLDGTVYRGREAIPGAPGAIAAARDVGARVTFVTNNAARTPEQVAAQLAAVGVPCQAGDVLTSAQAAARLLSSRVPRGAPVLVVGGEGLAAAVAAEGLQPVARDSHDVAAVVQGWSPDVAWPLLAEGAYALARGVPWVASNTDLTVPTGRGIAPGNGSFVRLLAGVVDRQPDAVAGKPGAEMLLQASAQFGAAHPLVVGDRLDTDIEGAVSAGIPALLVLTGVSKPVDVVMAAPDRRPTYVGIDLTALLHEPSVAIRVGDRWTAGAQAWATVDEGGVLHAGVANGSATVDDLVACAAAVWEATDGGHAPTVSSDLAARLGAIQR
jgi:HAD superfamily hydrolase (TIGR01450 family)